MTVYVLGYGSSFGADINISVVSSLTIIYDIKWTGSALEERCDGETLLANMLTTLELSKVLNYPKPGKPTRMLMLFHII